MMGGCCGQIYFVHTAVFLKVRIPFTFLGVRLMSLISILGVVPEIDPASASAALALLVGTTMMLRDRFLPRR